MYVGTCLGSGQCVYLGKWCSGSTSEWKASGERQEAQIVRPIPAQSTVASFRWLVFVYVCASEDV